MANQGLKSGVIIPLGEMGVRITTVFFSLYCAGSNRAKTFFHKIAVGWIKDQLLTD